MGLNSLKYRALRSCTPVQRVVGGQTVRFSLSALTRHGGAPAGRLEASLRDYMYLENRGCNYK